MQAIAPPPQAKTLIIAELPTVEPLIAPTYLMASHLLAPPRWGGWWKGGRAAKAAAAVGGVMI
jgi:hypothetical protein